jgi:hypothetical protein
VASQERLLAGQDVPDYYGWAQGEDEVFVVGVEDKAVFDAARKADYRVDLDFVHDVGWVLLLNYKFLLFGKFGITWYAEFIYNSIVSLRVASQRYLPFLLLPTMALSSK